MLVPVNGTEYSRRAAEVGIAVARACHAPLTALYVAPGGKKRSRRYEEAILKDISELAEAYDTEVRTAVLANVAAEEAILRELSRRQYNLVLIGTGRRPGEKLFEELEINGENLLKTRHPKIFVGKIGTYSREQVDQILTKFQGALAQNNETQIRRRKAG